MTTDNTAELIAAISARVEAATEGPWGISDHDGELAVFDVPTGMTVFIGDPLGTQTTADAEFLAHARQDIPFLLATVSALNVQLAEAGWKALEEEAEYLSMVAIVKESENLPFTNIAKAADWLRARAAAIRAEGLGVEG